MSEEVKNNGTTQVSKKKSVVWIAAAAVILLALAAGIGIYNAPANRLSRQLDLGNRYLENEQYEEAVLAFERAIDIDDRNMEAYAGAVEAYIGKGSQEELETFYDRTLAVIAELDEEFMAQNMEDIVSIYLAADRVYGADPRKVIQILEEGYAKTGANEEIRDYLIQAYLQAAKDAAAAASYEDALVMYDRLLELGSTNAETIGDLCNCLNKYIDVLLESRQYDRIRALAEKYRNVANGVDFDAILARVAELEKLDAENRAFMQNVYDLMAAEDYEGLSGPYYFEKEKAFEGDRYIYFPDDNESASGIGAGVYIDNGYLSYYYGTIENGERKGTGTEFWGMSDGSYSVFKGEWDKDAPNGTGVEADVFSNDGYSKVSSGTLKNGLWDGDVTVLMTDDGQEFDLSFRAENGIPTDRTQEYLSEGWWAGALVEGSYIYAYDYDVKADIFCKLSIKEGMTVGIRGFAGLEDLE